MNKQAILIAGATASGKSTLALKLAERVNGVIINADALQVYNNWRVLTARPSDSETKLVPHMLYGHVGKNTKYSVGEWIKDVSDVLDNSTYYPIIVGGTGLYFGALTNGLSAIPPIPDSVRARGDRYRIHDGAKWFRTELSILDPETFATLDQNNPARLQRAWEVVEATGKGLKYWHSQPAPALLPLEKTYPIVLNWEPDQLNDRIDQRFDIMLENGAIEECDTARLSGFNPELPSNRALGAKEIIDALDGKISMQDAVIKSKILTHQFAKRQRTWFRSKMKNWRQIQMPIPENTDAIVEDIATSIR